MNKYAIELTNVNFTNVDYIVLKNINIKVKKNTTTAIIGRSGAGKSTLLKLMAGILRPITGNVKINEFDLDNIHENELIKLKKKIGFVFQDAALLSNLNIKENLALPLKFHYPELDKNEIEYKILKYLDRVDMLDSLHERPAQLSLGERKLVAIARALITEPEILYLDEPLSSIDASISKRMIKLSQEFASIENTTLIIVTNLQSIIYELCEQMVMIDEKKIIFDDLKTNIVNMNPIDRPKLINDIFS